MKIGFIGLGSMGGPIALRIARSGYHVTGCDVSPAGLAAFDEPGTVREVDPVATAKAADILCVCVRNDQDLIDLAGDGTLFSALGEGGVFVVHSTVDPDLCRRLAIVAKAAGVGFIDAGVSGGGPAALAGELSLFVGGGEADFARVKPLFETYAKSIAHLGPVGRGMEGKLLNNLVSIANYGMAATILDLGEKLNFDREQLRQALMAGSAQGFALKAVPGLLRGNTSGAHDGVNSLHDMLKKDLDHARELAPADNVSMAALVASAESMLARMARAS